MGFFKNLFSDITLRFWETKLVALFGVSFGAVILLQWPGVVEALTYWKGAFWVFAITSWLYIMGVWVKRVVLKK